jgi:alpha-1,4-galacturonosyltransferase
LLLLLLLTFCVLTSEIVAHKLSVESPSRKAGEHKSRVLSEVTAAADGIEVLEQVTRREAQDGGLVSTDSEEQEKTTGSQQQSSSEVGSF